MKIPENSGRLSDGRKTNDYRSSIHQQTEAGTKHTRSKSGVGTHVKILVQIINLTR